MSVVTNAKSEDQDGFYSGQKKRPLSIIEENDGDEGDTGTTPVKGDIVNPAPEINMKQITIQTKVASTATANPAAKNNGIKKNEPKRKPQNIDTTRAKAQNCSSKPRSPGSQTSGSSDSKTTCKILNFSKSIRIVSKTDSNSKVPPPVAPKPKTPSPSPSKLKSPAFPSLMGDRHFAFHKSPTCSQSKQTVTKSKTGDTQTSEDEVVRSMKNIVKRTVSKIENHVASMTSTTKQKVKIDPPRRKISKEETPGSKFLFREKENATATLKSNCEAETSGQISSTTTSSKKTQELIFQTPETPTEAGSATDNSNPVPLSKETEIPIKSQASTSSLKETENAIDSPDSAQASGNTEIPTDTQKSTSSSKETDKTTDCPDSIPFDETKNSTDTPLYTPLSKETEILASTLNALPLTNETEYHIATLRSTPPSNETENLTASERSLLLSNETENLTASERSSLPSNDTENLTASERSSLPSNETENLTASERSSLPSNETGNLTASEKSSLPSNETENLTASERSSLPSNETENLTASERSSLSSNETESLTVTQKSSPTTKETESPTVTQKCTPMYNETENPTASLISTPPINDTESFTHPETSRTLSSVTEDTIAIIISTPNDDSKEETSSLTSSSSSEAGKRRAFSTSQPPSGDIETSSSNETEYEDTLRYQGEHSQLSTSESTTPEFTTPPSSPPLPQSKQISNVLFSPLLSSKTSHSSTEFTRAITSGPNSKSGQVLSDGQGLARIREAAESLKLTTSSTIAPKASPSPPSRRVPFSFRQSPKLNHRPFSEAYSLSSLNNAKPIQFNLNMLSLPSQFSAKGDSGTSDSESEDKSQNKSGEKSRMAPRSPFLAPKFHPRRGSYFFKRRISSESLASLSENESPDNTEEPTPISASDFNKLKETADRLHLSTRRPSVLQWRQQYVESPGASGFPFRNGMNGDSFDEKLTSDRKQKIDEALDWLRNELHDMRSQDQMLARQLLTIRNDIHQLKLRRCTTEHQELLDDFKLEIEEQQEFSDVLDIPQPIYEDNPLKHIGVTRLNISARRFSAC